MLIETLIYDLSVNDETGFVIFVIIKFTETTNITDWKVLLFVSMLYKWQLSFYSKQYSNKIAAYLKKKMSIHHVWCIHFAVT